MYKIETTDYGFHLVFGGVMEVGELRQWVTDSEAKLQLIDRPFYVLVDMRTLGPLDAEGKLLMKEGQAEYRAAGMQRSVVILNNPVTLMQFKRIAHESGIFEWERYIDASVVPNWQAVAMAWLLQGVDPANQVATLNHSI